MSVENSNNVLLAGKQTVEVEDWTCGEQFITDGRVGEANPELTKSMEVMLWAASPAEDPLPAPSPHALQALEEMEEENSVSVFNLPRQQKRATRKSSTLILDPPPAAEGTDLVFPLAVDLAELSENGYIARIQEISLHVQELALQFGFNDRTIPPCWASHLSSVAILSGLYGSYKCCFAPAFQGEQVTIYIRNLETARVCLERLVQNSSRTIGEHEPRQSNYWASEQLANTDKAWWAKYL